MRTVSPKTVIETALQHTAGAAPSIQTNAVMQALKSNGLRIVRDTAREITYCTVHPSVKMPCMLPHLGREPQGD